VPLSGSMRTLFLFFLGLLVWRTHRQPVEIVGHFDLARQTRIWPNVVTESSISSSIGEGPPTLSRQASST